MLFNNKKIIIIYVYIEISPTCSNMFKVVSIGVKQKIFKTFVSKFPLSHLKDILETQLLSWDSNSSYNYSS